MDTHRRPAVILVAGGIAAVSLFLWGCASTQTPAPSPSPQPTATLTPTPQPTETLDQTSMTAYEIADFEAAHSPLSGDANEHLIFGNVPVTPAAPGLSPDLADLLGRWEGYAYGPPVDKDWKFVMTIHDITAQSGKALLWAGTNVQYPYAIREIHFRVGHEVGNPSIEWQYQDGGATNRVKFIFDPDERILRGWLDSSQGNLGPIKLNRDRALTVFKDYPAYLAGKGITAQTYHNTRLNIYGKGYMLYLPDGYPSDLGKTWPMILFLHGSGDRGDNLYLLPKTSPFMMIRQKGPLPAIIVAPLLNVSQDYASFPNAYLDGVLAEVQAGYRIDPKRIYLTGISMGGEATYRFALHRPTTFAAIAPLSAFNPKYVPWATGAGYQPFDVPMGRIKDVPVWAIHGANDPVVSLDVAQQTVDDLKKAGGDVTFTVLAGHDHDTWDDTYSDPKFYEWLFKHSRP